MNKKKFMFLTIFILLVSTIWAGAYIINISAVGSDDNIIIKWTTSIETNLNHFIVERKTFNGSFATISQPIAAKGNNSPYEYVDGNVFKSNDLILIYRLKIIDNDNSISYSSEFSPPHYSVSSVRRTWGSIKALFR